VSTAVKVVEVEAEAPARERPRAAVAVAAAARERGKPESATATAATVEPAVLELREQESRALRAETRQAEAEAEAAEAEAVETEIRPAAMVATAPLEPWVGWRYGGETMSMIPNRPRSISPATDPWETAEKNRLEVFKLAFDSTKDERLRVELAVAFLTGQRSYPPLPMPMLPMPMPIPWDSSKALESHSVSGPFDLGRLWPRSLITSAVLWQSAMTVETEGTNRLLTSNTFCSFAAEVAVAARRVQRDQ
jgi:hypothetical protein